MSLKTRCPACDTVFKIVPDQLKISKGWVRCGRCAEVFDAAAHAAALDEPNQQTSQPETVATSKTASAKVAIAATLTTAKIAAKDVVITPKNVAAQAINTATKADLAVPKKQVETDLSFVKVAKSKAFWQQKYVAAGLRAACFGLASLLFLQVGFSQRNHLAAANPALKPSFESFCQTLGCKIEAFKNIDAFKIDSSSFQKAPMPSATVVANTDVLAAAQADAYTLKISLKNNIDLPLAMPSIELTLTDASDKPVLRRVLSTQDFGLDRGVRSDTLAANADWSGEMTVAVTANRALPPISGYRVLLFYP